MNIETETRAAATIARVHEARIDAAIAIDFRDRMSEIAAEGGTRLVLDLSEVEFLDSSGLGAIVGVMKEMEQGRRLELAGLSATVAKVFRLTRMESVFTIHPSCAAALAAPAAADRR